MNLYFRYFCEYSTCKGSFCNLNIPPFSENLIEYYLLFGEPKNRNLNVGIPQKLRKFVPLFKNLHMIEILTAALKFSEPFLSLKTLASFLKLLCPTASNVKNFCE